MKGTIKIIIIAVVMLVIMLIPLPADDLYLRFHVSEGEQEDYRLYYSTADNPSFDGEHYIDSSYDEKSGLVTFKIDAALEGAITGLRFDFPPAEGVTVIDGISSNSGGIVKNRFPVAEIFNDGNYLMVNGALLSTVAAREYVYASTTPDDPFVVFTPEVSSKMTSGFSHKFSTKLVIVLLIALGLFFYNKDYFGKLSTKGN